MRHDRVPHPSGVAEPTRPRWSTVLHAIREAGSVTQDGWAARLGVSRRTVQRWERGEWPPDIDVEGAILAYCRERDLFRTFAGGPLARLDLTPESLRALLTEARMAAAHPPATEAGPPVTSVPAVLGEPASNLPAALTSFIGREREIAAVRRLQAGTRLLTLTGAGGCGKTRLALEVARELLWAYPHGVRFIELAPLADPTLVPATVVASLGLQSPQPQSPLDALTAFLRERSMLLVLDNCEHLVAACAPLVEALLRACPQLSVIATSRESLGVGGEAIWHVPPLAVPSSEFRVPSSELDPSELGTRNSELEQPDAVRLFVERARLYRADVALTPENAAAVGEICRRLDGIPLAIELAAARVRALSVEQIAARLDDRLRLLTGGSRTSLPRHQTLRAALDWGYELLSAEEGALLRQLSVFAGGFTLEAAEHVADEEILEAVTSLVDKSLVIAEEEGGPIRYRLLETVRQYAAEKLEQTGAVAAVRDRHLDWCLALARSTEGVPGGVPEPQWLTHVEREHDNLRAALAWSLERRNGESALRLAGALAIFWERRGHLEEGRRWLKRALTEAPEAPAALRAKALVGAGVLAEMLGDSGGARIHHEESLCLYRQAGEQHGIAWAQAHLGRIAYRHGELASAQVQLRSSLTLYQDLGHKPGIADAQGRLGLIALRQGDLGSAQRLLEAKLVICRELADRDGTADVLEVLATVAAEQGDQERQVTLLQESLTHFREIHHRAGVALVLGSLGIAAWQRGDADRALPALEESLSLYRDVNDVRGIARLLSYQGTIALYRRDYARADALTREGLALHREMGDAFSIGRYLPVLAGAALARGAPERSALLFAGAAALRERLGTPLPEALQRDHDRAVAAARRALGDEPFAAAWGAGESMTLDELLACELDAGAAGVAGLEAEVSARLL